jgi:CPA2 family monovalent cation:H+ antiporter-2
MQLPFVVIELDQRRVDEYKQDNMSVIFGDAAQEIVLETGGIAHARLLLITIPNMVTVQTIVERVRHIHPELHIVTRVDSVEQMQVLSKQGVYEVVQPEFEAGLEIVRQALLHLKIPATEIYRYIDGVRRERYTPLLAINSGYETIDTLKAASTRLVELAWIELPEQSPVIGKSIGELEIRQVTGASVVGILRKGGLITNPSAATRFEAEDMLALIGDWHQVEQVRQLVR